MDFKGTLNIEFTAEAEARLAASIADRVITEMTKLLSQTGAFATTPKVLTEKEQAELGKKFDEELKNTSHGMSIVTDEMEKVRVQTSSDKVRIPMRNREPEVEEAKQEVTSEKLDLSPKPPSGQSPRKRYQPPREGKE